MRIMLFAVSFLFPLFTLVSSLELDDNHVDLFSRTASSFDYEYSDPTGHLFPREAESYADTILEDHTIDTWLSKRHAESQSETEFVPGYTQLYARKPPKKPSGSTAGIAPASKTPTKDKKAVNNKGSPPNSPKDKASAESEKAVKATATTLKEKFNWPPPNYGSMTPQERRVAAGRARTRQNRENTVNFRNTIAKLEEAGKLGSAPARAGFKASSKDSGSPLLPVSSETSSRSAFGPASKSSAAIQGLDSGKLSRQSSSKSSGVLVNTPDLLSPANSGVSGGWTLLNE